MALPKNSDQIIRFIQQELKTSKTGNKRLKVKSLMKKFNFQRRTEENTTEITELLKQNDIIINPSIMKLGDIWELSLEDWIYLSVANDDEDIIEIQEDLSEKLHIDWNKDGWFDTIINKKLRTEKEVETKFIIPLLFKLGYSEDDRYDDMPVSACSGSKATILRSDFALFNKNFESLKNQVLLTVEAKKEKRLKKPAELEKAQKQAKSYSIWTGCCFSMVTDSRFIQVHKLARNHVEKDKLLFSCNRSELKEKFQDIYRLISKDSLSEYYLKKQRTTEEIS
jgi:hypothetical protein